MPENERKKEITIDGKTYPVGVRGQANETPFAILWSDLKSIVAAQNKRKAAKELIASAADMLEESVALERDAWAEIIEDFGQSDNRRLAMTVKEGVCAIVKPREAREG